MTIKPEPDEQPKYRSQKEAAAALHGLSEEEHSRLQRIAHIYWSSRGLQDVWGSAEELLSEAFVRTLSGDGKRWRRGVDIVYHLRQAMRNLSGHLVGQRERQVMPKEEMQGDLWETSRVASLQSPIEAQVIARELLEALQHHFGPDREAFEFLLRRNKGMTEYEAAADMGIEDSRIEAVARRCRRKVASFKKRSNL